MAVTPIGDEQDDADERWWSLVGPAPLLEPSGFLTTPHDRFRALDRVYELGDVHLETGEGQLVDYVGSLTQGWSKLESWPILVFGNAVGEWPTVSRLAARAVHRLCCLLSLTWIEPWQVRIAPERASYLPPRVPEPVLVPKASFLVDLDSPNQPERDPQPLPDWLVATWGKLESDPAFRSRVEPALSLWHEGILLQPEHPSMSMVAYVAVIEQLANPVRDAADGRLLSGQTFWNAVESAAAPEDVAALTQADVYGKRSATAHGGGLHGIEMEFGHMLLQPIGKGDPTYDFMFDTLQRMKLVSRSLVLTHLV